MSIEEIIRAWKSDKQDESDQSLPENPAGDELTDEELEQVVGGRAGCDITCTETHCGHTGQRPRVYR